MADRDPALEWENRVVLMAIRALLGLVSPTLRGVAVEVDGTAITVHFAVSALAETTQEDIDDAVGDIEGLLLAEAPEVRSRIFVGSAGPGWEGRQHRLILLAKD